MSSSLKPFLTSDYQSVMTTLILLASDYEEIPRGTLLIWTAQSTTLKIPRNGWKMDGCGRRV